MVLSKRCKVCSLLDANNVQLSGEYFGKLIPDLIKNICGIEIDFRKASGVLICQPCVAQLVHTDLFIERLRNAVLRLKKTVKVSKPKTPAKHSPFQSKKIAGANESNSKASKQDKTDESFSKSSSVYEVKTQIEKAQMETPANDTFKKFSDGIATPIKRKRTPKLKPEGEHLLNGDAVDATPVKRNKKLSISKNEESPMNSVSKKDDTNCNNEISLKESKPKTRSCIICGKTFQSKCSLRDHIETSHMGERLKSCPHCLSEFRSKQKYESHVFSEKCKNLNHACQYPMCSKRFKTLHKMELHMQEKHSSNDE